MQTYIVRRNRLVTNVAELREALTRLRNFEDNPRGLNARWQRSYISRHANGFDFTCVFEAQDPQALQRHAELTELPAQEFLPVVAQLNLRAFAPTLVYQIRRRRYWSTAQELETSLAAARQVGRQMARSVSWLHSYAVQEDNGSLGTVCIYQSVSERALYEHACRAGMPADDVVPLIGRVAFRADPNGHSEFGITVPA